MDTDTDTDEAVSAKNFTKMELKTIFTQQQTTVYELVDGKWKKLGKGSLNLVLHPQHAPPLWLKFETEKNDLLTFEFKPKLKAKGDTSWLLKATVGMFYACNTSEQPYLIRSLLVIFLSATNLSICLDYNSLC